MIPARGPQTTFMQFMMLIQIRFRNPGYWQLVWAPERRAILESNSWQMGSNNRATSNPVIQAVGSWSGYPGSKHCWNPSYWQLGLNTRATRNPEIHAICSWSGYPGDEHSWNPGCWQLALSTRATGNPGIQFVGIWSKYPGDEQS